MPTVKTVTLTGDLSSLLVGVDLERRLVRARLESNAVDEHGRPVPIIDTNDSGALHFGTAPITLAADGTFSLPGIIASDATGINIIDGSLRYRVVVDVDDRATGRTLPSWDSGWLNLTASADLKDIAGSSVAIPPVWSDAFRTEMEGLRDDAEQAVIDAADASRLEVGTTATGAPGSSVAVTITGAAGSQKLNLTIPVGETGDQGEPGPPGRSITSVTRTSGDGSPGSTDEWTIAFSSGSPVVFEIYNGTDGTDGQDGDDGRGIVSITRTSGSGAPGTTDTYTITYTDSTTSTFQVYNGANGAGAGDVVGPASSVTNRVAVFDGTSGKLLKDGGATVADVRDRSTHTGTQPASTITGLGTAATQDASAFATAAQGSLADTAVQPASLGNSASRNVGTGSGDVAAGNLGVPASGTTGHVLTKTSGGFAWAAPAGGTDAADRLAIAASVRPGVLSEATANVGAALDNMRQVDGLASNATLRGCATMAAVLASSTAKAAVRESASAVALTGDPLWAINIGDPLMGGFYAGIIDTTKGNIIAADASQTGLRYALIVAPKSLESASLQYKTANSAAPAAASTRWDGLTATAAMNSATYPAAQWCAGRTKPSGDDASEWYLPAMDELELIYRNLKASTESNYTTATTGSTFPGGTQNQGYNPSSDPAGAAYSSSVPAQTSVAAFKTGGAEALGLSGGSYYHWSATEYNASRAWIQDQSGSYSGAQGGNDKTLGYRVRPVRRLIL